MRELSFNSPIVVVHAHPDDETLTSGALLASTAASGSAVTLVTCTRGEQGEVIGDDPLKLEGNAAALGEFREEELDRAMDALGVVDHIFLDQIDSLLADARESSEPSGKRAAAGKESVRYVDSGMAWVDAGLGPGASAEAKLGENVPENAFSFADLDLAARSLARLVIARGAKSLVTYERGGGYGHPDHKRAHELVVRAGELLTAEYNQDVQILVAIKPTSIARKSREVLLEQGLIGAIEGVSEGGIIPEIDEGYGSEASYEPASVLYVRTLPVAQQLFASMNHHKTQIKWASAITPVDVVDDIKVIGSFALSNDIIAPVLSHEFYCELTSL